MNERVDIVMATYNGMPYIREQLQSILWQDYPEFRLLIHDDGSTDGTVEEIRKVAKRYPDKVVFIEDGITFKDAKKNFEHLLKMTEADYIFLADQDDVWLPSKISRMVEAIKTLEDDKGSNFPLLAYSDYFTIDKQDDIIFPELVSKRKSWYSNITLNMQFITGKLPGCASGFNRSLLRIALPFPDEAKWHDHWLSLVASACGGLFHVPFTTTLYRIHDTNAIGVKPELTFQQRVRRWFAKFDDVVKGVIKQGEEAKGQARALLVRLESESYAMKDSTKMIEDFIEFCSGPFYTKLKLLKKFGDGDLPHNLARALLWK